MPSPAETVSVLAVLDFVVMGAVVLVTGFEKSLAVLPLFLFLLAVLALYLR